MKLGFRAVGAGEGETVGMVVGIGTVVAGGRVAQLISQTRLSKLHKEWYLTQYGFLAWGIRFMVLFQRACVAVRVVNTR